MVLTQAIENAKSACVSYLPTIERAHPGDGAAIKVPVDGVPGGSVRVTCYKNSNGEIVVKVGRIHVKHKARHYHIVFDETQP